MQPGAVVPELCLLAGALVCLVGGSFLPRRRQWVARMVALAALAASATVAAFDLADPARPVFDATYLVDTPLGVARIVIAVATALVVCLASDEIAGDTRESETYTLLLLAAAGAMLLAGAGDLLVVITGYLLASIPLYGLVGMGRTPAAAEAAMKAYLFGALLGIGLMLGVVVCYGVAGTTGYAGLAARLDQGPTAAVAFGAVAVLGGLMFKAGGVPGHFWVPDAAEGSSAAAAAFLTTVPKVGAVVAAFRFVAALPEDIAWPLLVAILATVSMTLGNLAAFAQTDPRRLLGWSTVSQVGYALVPVAVVGDSALALPSMLIYLTGYAVTNATAFALAAAFPRHRTLASYRGLARSSPWTGAALVVALLGLVGTPPTVVFVGKLTVATAAWDGGLAWLAVVVMANSVASLFYYLRWIVPAFTAPAVGPGPSPTAAPWAARTAVVAAASSLLLGIGAGPLWLVVDGTILLT